jgi:hypothetical protein
VAYLFDTSDTWYRRYRSLDFVSPSINKARKKETGPILRYRYRETLSGGEIKRELLRHALEFLGAMRALCEQIP